MQPKKAIGKAAWYVASLQIALHYSLQIKVEIVDGSRPTTDNRSWFLRRLRSDLTRSLLILKNELGAT